MKYEAVIFDLWGTLVSHYSIRHTERTTAELSAILSVCNDDFSHAWNHGTWVQRETGEFGTVEENIAHCCEALGCEVNRDQISQAAQAWVESTQRALKPRPDAASTINRLRDSGHKIGLISNCASDVPLVWPENPLSSLVDETVFSCNVELVKPDPRIYRLACDRLAVPPERCVFVGDGSGQELTGAANVGMDAILFRIPLDDVYDSDRLDVAAWQGPEISTLSEVLTFVPAA